MSDLYREPKQFGDTGQQYPRCVRTERDRHMFNLGCVYGRLQANTRRIGDMVRERYASNGERRELEEMLDSVFERGEPVASNDERRLFPND